jgi:hypothetical protein
MKNILFLPMALIGFVFLLLLSIIPDPVAEPKTTK